jgi:hypothetical protein
MGEMRSTNKRYWLIRDYLEHVGVNGRTTLKLIFRKQDARVGAELITAENRDQWRALVNTVMKLRVYKRRGSS